MNELPIGWTLAKLGDLGGYLNGAAFKPQDWVGEGTPIIRIQNLTDPSKPLNRTRRKLDNKYLVHRGDLLVSWSATLDAFIWNQESAWLNQHIFKVSPSGDIDRRFLFYLLKTEIAALVETEHLHGTTMKHINRGPFLAHEVALPPTLEQRRIVARIDGLLARVNSARDNLLRVPPLLDHFREALLDNIFNSCSNEVSLGEIISFGPQNGLYLPRTAYGDGIPILRIENYDFHSAEARQTWKKVQLPPEASGRYALRAGDIVVNRVNSPSHLGKSLLVTPEHVPAVFESNMMRFRVKDIALPEYVQLLLSSDRGRALLTSRAKWAVNQASINQSDVAATLLPLPAHSEQERIIRELKRHQEGIEQIFAESQQGCALLDHLAQGLLSKAFSGELVPQDSNDEPASVLLARIRNERLGSKQPRRGRGGRRGDRL